jgi:Ca2+-binding EF-hand superfamily protein
MTKLPLAVALLGAATAALAQTPAAPAGGISFDQWSVHARERLMALDANHDGKISKDEFAARAGMMGHHRKGGAAEDANAPKPDGARMFTRLDANNDGYLDATEINAMLARRFARQDANHDGVLTPDEQHAMRGMSTPEQ